MSQWHRCETRLLAAKTIARQEQLLPFRQSAFMNSRSAEQRSLLPRSAQPSIFRAGVAIRVPHGPARGRADGRGTSREVGMPRRSTPAIDLTEFICASEQLLIAVPSRRTQLSSSFARSSLKLSAVCSALEPAALHDPGGHVK